MKLNKIKSIIKEAIWREKKKHNPKDDDIKLRRYSEPVSEQGVVGLCSDFENYASITYGIETWEFCSKCETGSYTDAECACCTPPTGGGMNVATPNRGEKPNKDPFTRMKKLAGLSNLGIGKR